MRPIMLGIFAAFFFAITFILNRSMDLAGGSWIWSASLRYFFMVPFLVLIVMGRKNFKPLLLEMKKQPGIWFLWSTVGFGFFYAPICFSACFRDDTSKFTFLDCIINLWLHNCRSA